MWLPINARYHRESLLGGVGGVKIEVAKESWFLAGFKGVTISRAGYTGERVFEAHQIF